MPLNDSAAVRLFHLRQAGVSVVFDGRGDGQPTLAYWGDDLGELTDEELVSALRGAAPGIARSGSDVPLPRGLVPERAWGYRGRPGLAGHREGADFAPRLVLISADRTAGGGDSAGTGVDFVLADAPAGLSVRSAWRLSEAGLLLVDQSVANTGSTRYQLTELAAVVPVGADATELMDFTGRWCRERAPQRMPFNYGAWTRENRRGRTGFDSVFAMVAGSAGFANRHGRVWAVHLGWSGDQAAWAEAQPDGVRVIGAAELLAPGEVVLGPGESYRAPTVYAAFSGTGLDGIAERFHRYLRSRPAHPSAPRPAVLNTWEAVYFDHDLDRLKALADRAAEVGIERFVLDDGWFGGRRDDTSSLGDWEVSTEVWPDGLGPLVDYVTGLGLQFGLWVEPEMINPDSDLFRAHPEWVLAPPGELPPAARHQQVVDVARPEVFDHLFARLDGLVKEYGIGYLKWDHNRDLVRATHDGRAGVHAQTAAVYRLIDELKAANPGLEIESCSSGGARVDLGILARTDRVWASDCNDALERQHIQRWTGLLLPPELVGSHVGPPVSHTTGRTHSLSFRAATALFGHFGVEWDIASIDDADRQQLAAAIAVYQRLRPLLHTGTAVHADHPDPAATVSGTVSSDRRQAVFCYAQLRSGADEQPAPMKLPGLDPDIRYRVTVLEMAGGPDSMQRGWSPWLIDGEIRTTGRALELVGLTPPALTPEQAFLVELVAT